MKIIRLKKSKLFVLLFSNLKLYKAKVKDWIMTLSCPDYLKRVEKALIKEESRADLFLAPKTKKLI
jgi:hypothetical protein